MPWKVCKPMDERLKFIARLLDGEKMAVACRDFGISRKTGYKILTRYNEIGLDGLTDHSRRPYRHANQLSFQIETQIVRLKQDKPSWGAPKIREKLSRLYPDVHTPAISTVHAVLDRHGLVKRRMRRRNKATGTALSFPGQPNDLWCADYKGEFMLADRRYCYPLTITDFASRYSIQLSCGRLTPAECAHQYINRGLSSPGIFGTLLRGILSPRRCLLGRFVRHSREFELEAVRLLELGQRSASELALGPTSDAINSTNGKSSLAARARRPFACGRRPTSTRARSRV